MLRPLAILFLVLAGCTRAVPPASEPDPQQKQRAFLEAEVKALRPRAGDDEVAKALAQTLIELGRLSSETAHRDDAERVIAPLAERTPPDPEALILRATIKQSRHDFAGALVDLQRALELAPASAQGWLTLSVILGVRGDFAAAKRACRPLEMLSTRLAIAGCEANIDGVSGNSSTARESLEKALAASPQASAPEKIWALVMIAEIAARQGDRPGAESAFARARALGLRDEYLLAAYSDYLLGLKKFEDVQKLLEHEANVEPLLLRLAIAEKHLRAATAEKHRAMLGAVHAQNRQRGDLTHRREEARYYLELENNVPAALRAAKENFEVQREPADLQVLLESALAAKDRTAAEPALKFLQSSQLEDARLAKIAEELSRLPLAEGSGREN